MSTKTQKPTRMDIPQNQRDRLVEMLNVRLADLLDYSLSIKQAHWNVKGRQFVALHEMLDTMFADAVEYADLAAERGVMLGGTAQGTLAAVKSATNLTEFPARETSMGGLLTALADRLGKVVSGVRTGIAFAEEHGDAATADVMTEIARGLDKQLWYLEAHLND